METKLITCIQCENEFEFTAVEQQYFQDKGFDDPKRCPACRRHKSRSDREKKRSKDKKWEYYWKAYDLLGDGR